RLLSGPGILRGERLSGPSRRLAVRSQCAIPRGARRAMPSRALSFRSYPCPRGPRPTRLNPPHSDAKPTERKPHALLNGKPQPDRLRTRPQITTYWDDWRCILGAELAGLGVLAACEYSHFEGRCLCEQGG